jgi:hypothetical protein
MSDANKNNAEGPSGPSVVYTRFRKRTPAEIAELPPVRTKPIEFKGTGLGPFGLWPWGEGESPRTAVYKRAPTKDATEALLDWAVVSRARRHVFELVYDFTRDERPNHELPSDAEVLAITREAGLEAVD